MSKSVYVRVVHHLELLRYVLRCAIERQLYFPTGINKVYYYCFQIRTSLSAVMSNGTACAQQHHVS